MKFFAIILMSLMIVTQAQALSCLRPNIAETFNRLDASDRIYRIAVGTVRLTSKPAKYIDGKPRKARAEFQGRFLGKNGLGAAQTLPIVVQTHCVAHWCGGFPDGRDQEFLMFLERIGENHQLNTDACPSGAMVVATDKRVELLRSCLKRGKCSKSAIAKGELY